MGTALYTGVTGLQAHQRRLDVVAANIANVNTPGYTRQRADLENSNAIDSSPGQMGGGVKADE